MYRLTENKLPNGIWSDLSLGRRAKSCFQLKTLHLLSTCVVPDHQMWLFFSNNWCSWKKICDRSGCLPWATTDSQLRLLHASQLGMVLFDLCKQSANLRVIKILLEPAKFFNYIWGDISAILSTQAMLGLQSQCMCCEMNDCLLAQVQIRNGVLVWIGLREGKKGMTLLTLCGFKALCTALPEENSRIPKPRRRDRSILVERDQVSILKKEAAFQALPNASAVDGSVQGKRSGSPSHSGSQVRKIQGD